MPVILDLVGQQFGRLTVRERIGGGRRGIWWRCTCACGGSHEVTSSDLRAGAVSSCGCFRRDKGHAKFIDRTGERVGKLVLLERGPDTMKTGVTRWWCQCDCGNKKLIRGSNIKLGNVISCGCERQNRFDNGFVQTHGQSRRKNKPRTPEHACWLGIHDRCRNPKNKAYRFYGARGIRVAPEWSEFMRFLADVGPRPSPAHSLDRIDTRRGYEPGNCRWATKDVQMNNMTSNRFLDYRGKRLTVTQWARIAGMKSSTLRRRLDGGWQVEDALWAPESARSRWHKKKLREQVKEGINA